MHKLSRTSGEPEHPEADDSPKRRHPRTKTTPSDLESGTKQSDPALDASDIAQRESRKLSTRLVSRLSTRLTFGYDEVKKSSFTVWSQTRYTVFNSWLNLLLIFVPIGFVVNYTNYNAVVVFAINFIAILPVAANIDYASEEVKLRVGETWSVLINATFGNAVQLVTSILLLKNRQIILLQISLIGSILANMHFTLGLGFFLGGLRRVQQYFNLNVGQLYATMLLLAMAALIMPTVISVLEVTVSKDDILRISRAISVVLLSVYGFFMYFSLKSHRQITKEQGEKTPSLHRKKGDASSALFQSSVGLGAAFVGGDGVKKYLNEHTLENFKEPQLSFFVALCSLLVFTVFLAFNTAFATDSLDGLIESAELTETFIGIVLLPLLGVDFTLFSLAIEDNMDSFLGLTVGKCLQTALLVIPILVLLGWIINVPMGLNFDPFEVVALFASVMYINSMIQVGKSYYLQGVLLLGLFIIIAIVSYCVPANVAAS